MALNVMLKFFCNVGDDVDVGIDCVCVSDVGDFDVSVGDDGVVDDGVYFGNAGDYDGVVGDDNVGVGDVGC